MHVKIIRGIVTFPSDLNPSNICDIFCGFGGSANNIHVWNVKIPKRTISVKIHVNRVRIGIVTMLLHQPGPQLKFPSWRNKSIYAISV